MLLRVGSQRTQEQIVGIWAGSPNLEYLYHVEELAVDVADDGDGGSDVHHIALLHKELLGLCTYGLNDRLGQQLLLVQARYAFVQVDGS